MDKLGSQSADVARAVNVFGVLTSGGVLAYWLSLGGCNPMAASLKVSAALYNCASVAEFAAIGHNLITLKTKKVVAAPAPAPTPTLAQAPAPAPIQAVETPKSMKPKH